MKLKFVEVFYGDKCDMDNPFRLVVTASVLLVIGVVLPYMMVLGHMPSTLFLNFVTIAAQIAGLFVGFIGISMYIRTRR